MGDFSHSDLVLLREVLHADCNVCQALISFADRQAGRLMPCTCSVALATTFLTLGNLTIWRSVTLCDVKSPILLLNRKDKAVGHTSVLWICGVVMKIPGPFLNF